MHSIGREAEQSVSPWYGSQFGWSHWIRPTQLLASVGALVTVHVIPFFVTLMLTSNAKNTAKNVLFISFVHSKNK